jgi:hypothetical protein
MIRLRNKDVVIQCLTAIEECHEHIEALHGAGRFIRTHLPHETHGDSVYHDLLMKIELEQWRNLFMWALTVDAKTQARIRAAAHERFLVNRMSVTKWLSIGSAPMAWLEADEEEFRKMAREVFAPK